MGRTTWIIAAIVAVGLAGAAFYGFVLREDPVPRGALVEALLEEPSENKLTEVFARFVDVDASLLEQAPVLLANGFRCGIDPAYVEGSSFLSCQRPVEGTGHCRGYRYYSYQSRTGEIIEVLGSVFDRPADRNILGRCEDIRQHYYGLADELEQIERATER